MTNQPFFSICLPTYNYCNLLPDAIASVLNQSFDDFELLIQDDGSVDNTDEVVARYRDARIVYEKNEANSGIFGNLNKLCARAKGRYVKILCADDILSTWCLATIFEALKQTNFRYKLVSVRETPDRIAIERPPLLDALEIFSLDRNTLFHYLSVKDHWGGGLAELCIENEYFRSRGFFGPADKAKDFSKDILTWCEMILTVDALMINHPLVFQRPHAGQARYKLARITQLREILAFFYGRANEFEDVPDFAKGRSAYLDRYVLSHYWYGMKSMLAGQGWDYLRETRRLLRQFGHSGFPAALAALKVKEKLIPPLKAR